MSIPAGSGSGSGSGTGHGRPAASVVIPAWNAWSATEACLASLLPTLGPDDQVVVVDNGSQDETPKGLASLGWVDVVTNATNRGFASGCNQGAAAAINPVVVFLNNDTLVPGGWLEGLLELFAEPSIGAAGPRSNFVSGPQILKAPYGDRTDVTVAEVESFASEHQSAHRGQFSDVRRLVGFCLAVRRALFEDVGGFDELFGTGGHEDDDLCRRILEAGYRLVIAHGSYVHHEGHRTFDENGISWREVEARNKVYFVTGKFVREVVGDLPDPIVRILSAVAACPIDEDLPGMVAAAARDLPAAERALLVAQTLNLPPGLADNALDGLLRMWPEDLAVLACAVKVAPNLPEDRSARWWGRLRSAGLGELCPSDPLHPPPADDVRERTASD